MVFEMEVWGKCCRYKVRSIFLNCTTYRCCEAVCLPSHSEICLNWPVGEAVIVSIGLDDKYS